MISHIATQRTNRNRTTALEQSVEKHPAESLKPKIYLGLDVV